MRVVFTGPAPTINGVNIKRDDITKAATMAGHVVRGAVDSSVHLLVASRKDTMKAVKAAKLGVQVQTYQEFIASLAFYGVYIEISDAPPNPFCDEVQWDGKLGSLL